MPRGTRRNVPCLEHGDRQLAEALFARDLLAARRLELEFTDEMVLWTLVTDPLRARCRMGDKCRGERPGPFWESVDTTRLLPVLRNRAPRGNESGVSRDPVSRVIGNEVTWGEGRARGDAHECKFRADADDLESSILIEAKSPTGPGLGLSELLWVAVVVAAMAAIGLTLAV